ncbi:MAG: hypothetical protein CVU91_13475 [Firmicutes bacterium HGW-Firmicutes-16]|nr:MAG: hypothetical protein CVU91_13475 [Firmicutes bacterium HGW-Firmicutes-16]
MDYYQDEINDYPDERRPALWANIPSGVLYSTKLKPNAKIIYGVISTLAFARGYCNATNGYIGWLLSLSAKAVSESISQLAEHLYITVELVKGKEGTNKSRNIWINGAKLGFEYPPENSGGGIPKKRDTPPVKSVDTPPQKVKEIYTRGYKRYIAPENIVKMLEDYADGNEQLKKALMDFAEMRAKTKAPITTEATVKLLLNNLDKLSGGSDAVRIAMLEEAILKNWKTVYAPKDGCASKKVVESEDVPTW